MSIKKTEEPVSVEVLRCAKILLLNPPITPVPLERSAYDSSTSLHSAKSAKSAKSFSSLAGLKSPISRAFFGRLSRPIQAFRPFKPFALIRTRSFKKQYDQIEEKSLISQDRRGSDDSDLTLVDALIPNVSDVPITPISVKSVDNASHLLEILAPLVASLQSITPRVASPVGMTKVLHMDVETVCEALSSLLEELSFNYVSTGNDYSHDLEMTTLMLDALKKKVEKERHTVQSLSQAINQSDIPSTGKLEMIDETDDNEDFETAPSSLVMGDKNPFVLHATSITLSSSRRSSVGGKGIPIGPNILRNGPPMPYAGAQPVGIQQTWARNVIRLGSFQNSMLFSPSPVAVRSTALVSPHHQPLQMQID